MNSNLCKFISMYCINWWSTLTSSSVDIIIGNYLSTVISFINIFYIAFHFIHISIFLSFSRISNYFDLFCSFFFIFKRCKRIITCEKSTFRIIKVNNSKIKSFHSTRLFIVFRIYFKITDIKYLALWLFCSCNINFSS